jgi:caa(3)-type oxidase subunit IV
MHAKSITPPIYVLIGVVLIALTFLTVGLSFVEMEARGRIAVGLTIALVKATLVTFFFMHALFSSRVTWLVILVGAVWLGILAVLVLSDYASRGMVPYMPGH